MIDAKKKFPPRIAAARRGSIGRALTAAAAAFVVVVSAAVFGLPPAAAQSGDDLRLLEITGSGATLDDRMGEIRALLAKGANPNAADAKGRTPVHHAASRGSSQQALRLLLKSGGRTDVKDADGNTPLHLGADGSASGPFFDSVDAIKALLSHKANPNAVNGEGETPLHIAVRTHKIKPWGIRLLLRAGADPNRVDPEGITPFHIALRGSLRYFVIREFLKRGAGIWTPTPDGLTALQLFVRRGHDNGDIVRALLEAGADSDGKYPNGNTPLHEAIRSGGTGSGKTQVVEALLGGGADPCIEDAAGYIPYQIVKDAKGRIRTALDRAHGHELACDEKDRRKRRWEAARRAEEAERKRRWEAARRAEEAERIRRAEAARRADEAERRRRTEAARRAEEEERRRRAEAEEREWEERHRAARERQERKSKEFRDFMGKQWESLGRPNPYGGRSSATGGSHKGGSDGGCRPNPEITGGGCD